METRKDYFAEHGEDKFARYVIDCITNSTVFDDEPWRKRPQNCGEAIWIFNRRYEAEYSRNFRNPNTPLAKKYAEYLRCLPSICSVEYRNYYIGEIGKNWGTTRSTESFVAIWWYNCGAALARIAKFYGII